MEKKEQELLLAFWRRFMSVTEDSFLLVDKHGKIVDMSDSYYSDLSISKYMTKAELIGMDVEDVFFNSRLPGLLKEKDPTQVNMEVFPAGADLPVKGADFSFCIRTL